MGSVSLTELRQNLFTLADQVAETGEPLVIERRGVRLCLIRETVIAPVGRLERLVQQKLTIGAPLAPGESPAAWSEDAWPKDATGEQRAAETVGQFTVKPRARRKPKPKPKP